MTRTAGARAGAPAAGGGAESSSRREQRIAPRQLAIQIEDGDPALRRGLRWDGWCSRFQGCHRSDETVIVSHAVVNTALRRRRPIS